MKTSWQALMGISVDDRASAVADIMSLNFAGGTMEAHGDQEVAAHLHLACILPENDH